MSKQTLTFPVPNSQGRSYRSLLRPLALAVPLAIAAAFSTGVAHADMGLHPSSSQKSLEIRADKLQTHEDEATLTRQRGQLKKDEMALKSDTRAGRMAAESPDAERVLREQRAIDGKMRAIRTDKPGSMQWKTDETALKSDRGSLAKDRKILMADSRSGRMAAESRDAEKVYRDRQAITGEKKDLAIDRTDSGSVG